MQSARLGGILMEAMTEPLKVASVYAEQTLKVNAFEVGLLADKRSRESTKSIGCGSPEARWLVGQRPWPVVVEANQSCGNLNDVVSDSGIRWSHGSL